MDIFQSIILGFTQGVTEFMPISSSGHLEIVQQLLGQRGADFHLFLEFINLGTLCALLIYYRKRIWKILKDIFQKRNYRFALNIVITCIPAGLAGLFFSDFIEETPFFSSLATIGVMMGVVGLLMIVVDKLPHASYLKSEEKLSPARALAIGCAQVFALIPGTSRSGTTIIAGRMAGLSNKSAADYSFLVSIPLMSAVCLKMFLSSTSRAFLVANWQMLLLSNLVAFVVGFFVLSCVMRFFKRPKSLQAFGYYRVILACVLIAYVLLQG